MADVTNSNIAWIMVINTSPLTIHFCTVYVLAFNNASFVMQTSEVESLLSSLIFMSGNFVWQ